MSNRRSFLKNISFSAGAMASLPVFLQDNAVMEHPSQQKNTTFNMCGYAAPKIENVKVGIIGLGMRGPGAVERISFIEGATIAALCDKLPERVEKAQLILTKKGLNKAVAYDGEEGWKALCARKDIDLIYICTPWHLHTPMAVYAMEQGKHVAVEVPAALTLDECWQLVETSEKTKKHCMMLENCCYDFFEALTLAMAQKGLFGELVHAEGAYIHDLMSLNFSKNGYENMWRLRENAQRNGNPYPTHGLGPIAQCLNINRGDNFDYMVSMSTNDFMMRSQAEELAGSDNFFKEFAGHTYRGNMNTSLIRTHKGKTVMVQHDVSSPRPYSRIHLLSGTKGVASKWPSPERIAFGHSWLKPEQLKELYQEHTPELVKHVGDIAKQIGGHGGMDFIMDWRLIDSLRNGLPLDQDVYDAASWSSVVHLSNQSVDKRSATLDVPDFTRGNWKTNRPVDLSLRGGGSTKVRTVQQQGSQQLKAG